MDQYVIHNNVEIPPIRWGQPVNREPLADALTRLAISRAGKGPAVQCDGLSYTGILRAVRTVQQETGRKFVIRRVEGEYWVWRVRAG